MKDRFPAALLLLLSLFLLVLISLRFGTPPTDLQFFQLESKLLYVIVSSLALGALLMFVLISLTFRVPAIKQERQSDPIGVAPLIRKAETALHLGDEEKAEKLLLGLPPPNPDYWYARKMLAELAVEKEDWVRADEFYGESLSAATGEQRAWVLLGMAAFYEQQQLLERAYQMYEEAVRLAPDSPEPALRLRLHCIREEEWQKALTWQEHLEQHFPAKESAVKESTNGAGIRYELAQWEYREGSFKTAQALLKYVFRLTDSFVPAYLLAGEIQMELKNPTAALKLWERGFQNTESPALLKRIGRHFLSQNLPETAIEFFRNVLRNHPERISFEFCLGDLYQNLEMNHEALRVFQKIQERRPEWPLNRYRLAGLYEKVGQTNEALREYREGFPWKEGGPIGEWKCYNCNRMYSEYRSFCSDCLQWGWIDLNQDEAEEWESIGYGQSTAWPI
jgi:tetratricopeptide (TPR) repeat protein